MENGVILIDKCPVCGSKRRFVEELAKTEKEEGRMRRGLGFCTHIIRDSVVDREMVNQMPYGTEIPLYEVWMDICLGYPDKPCGNIYAVKIVKDTATKKPKLEMPGDQMPGQFNQN